MHSIRNARRWRPRALVAWSAALSLITAQTAQATNVRLFVLAPAPPNSMDWVEQQGSSTPWFQRDFQIPYAVVEPLIRNEVKSKADGTRTGTVVCDDPCPDVTWTVTITSDFNFTQKGQPVVKAFGNPQQNGVDISVHAQARLNFNIYAKAETWFDSADGNFPVELVIGADASTKLNLWPTLQSHDVDFKLKLDSSNIDLSDINGQAVKLGAELGIILGFTPVGLALGGPLGLGALLAVLGGEAADVAEQKIKDAANKAFNDFLTKAGDRIKTEMIKQLDAAIAQGNDLKDKLLSSKLPGIGKSYQELSNAFGLTLDVQTTTPGGGVTVIVTPRFKAAAGGGTINGKVRLPKEQCVYVKNKILGVVPVGLVSANEDLASKVGTSCATIFSAASFSTSGYLGANPKSVGGAGASALSNWKNVGNVGFSGNLVDFKTGAKQSLSTPTGYYECSFQISGLPNADIIELRPSSQLAEQLTDVYGQKSRYLEVSALGLNLVLDSDWKVVATGAQSVTVGGLGGCGRGGGGTGLQSSLWQQLKDKFDPEKCPQCGITLKGGILEVTDPDPLLANAQVKAVFDAAEKANAGAKHFQFNLRTSMQGGLSAQRVTVAPTVPTPQLPGGQLNVRQFEVQPGVMQQLQVAPQQFQVSPQQLQVAPR